MTDGKGGDRDGESSKKAVRGERDKEREREKKELWRGERENET